MAQMRILLTISTVGALCLFGCKAGPKAAADDAPVTLTVLATNDFHGALYETPIPGDKTSGQAIGGLPWLVAAVEHHRAEDPDLLLLDGGDEFQGSWPVNATRAPTTLARPSTPTRWRQRCPASRSTISVTTMPQVSQISGSTAARSARSSGLMDPSLQRSAVWEGAQRSGSGVGAIR